MRPLRATFAARAETLLQRHWWRARPSWLSWLLQPLSWLYGMLVARHLKRGVTHPAAPAPVPVVVVGNLVVGGAGKTPTVIALVQALQSAGWHPGVLSRGYGRSSDELQAVTATAQPRGVGDEPLLIQRRTQVPVWVGRDRHAAALALCREHPVVDVLVSDDGLQHHGLQRQAELVVFDERGAGNGLLLPAGPLREPLKAAAPAQTPRWVLYTGGTRSTPLPGALAQRQATLAIALPDWWQGMRTQAVPLASLQGTRLVAAAGLAHPQKFFDTLHAQGLSFSALPLPDHFGYETLPWPEGTADVITTEKDAVKLRPERLGATRVWVVPLDLALPAGLLPEIATALRRPAPVLP
jgi:tetraacyldisaccharide 4'-kinase